MLYTHDEGLTEADQQALLDAAEQSLQFGLATDQIFQPDLSLYPQQLGCIAASFVTLRRSGRLRGCVGSIRPSLPLVSDVSRNAYEAAFCDTRFPAVVEEEMPSMSIQVSVLSPHRHLQVRTLADAIQQVRPGIDGVTIRRGKHVATFLPDVWETVPDPVDFFRHLRVKAGMKPDKWHSNTQVSTYTTQHASRSQES